MASGRAAFLGLASLSLLGCGDADLVTFQGEQRIDLSGSVPAGSETHFFLSFEVPPGVAEIEVHHDDLSAENILDWGLDDPNGFRGWGGGKAEP